MKKITYQTFNFTIAAGATKALIRGNRLWEGRAIRAVIHLDGALPNQLVSFGINSGQNTTLIEPSSLKDWQQRSGGDYLNSMKPLDIKGGEEINLLFTAETALGSEIKGQVMFVIEQNC